MARPGAFNLANSKRVSSVSDKTLRQYVDVGHPNSFNTTASYAVAQTNTPIVAAPAVGVSIHITDVILSRAGAGTIKLVERTATPTDKLAPIELGASVPFGHSFQNPLILSPNANLGVTSVGAGNHSVTVHGYYAKP